VVCHYPGEERHGERAREAADPGAGTGPARVGSATQSVAVTASATKWSAERKKPSESLAT
jgi:hypothetical protein